MARERRRKHVVNLRLTDEEAAELDRCRGAADRSTYIRAAIQVLNQSRGPAPNDAQAEADRAIEETANLSNSGTSDETYRVQGEGPEPEKLGHVEALPVSNPDEPCKKENRGYLTWCLTHDRPMNLCEVRK